MAAFSYENQTFIDCFSLPENSIKMHGFEEQINGSFFSHYPSGFPAHTTDKIPETMGSASSSEVFCQGGEMGGVEEGEFVKKWSNGGGFIGEQDPDCSAVEVGCADQVVQQSLMEKKSKNGTRDKLNSAQNKESKEGKAKKAKTEKKPKTTKNTQRKVCGEPPNGYIHVRARRGQATDSHSLAERVRREKISEKMKLLQGLVPGCDKVTSKAVMLDEIINYVQSLQNQVEFLSMKLASVNPMFYDFIPDFEDSMIKSEKLTYLAPPLSLLQQSSETQLKPGYEKGPTFANPTAFPATTNYPLLDSSVSILINNQRPNAFLQDNGNLCWNAEDPMQRFIDQERFNKMVCKGTETFHDQDQHSQSKKGKKNP